MTTDKRWFRPAHIKHRTLHAFGFWLGWWFIGIQVGRGWNDEAQP